MAFTVTCKPKIQMLEVSVKIYARELFIILYCYFQVKAYFLLGY